MVTRARSSANSPVARAARPSGAPASPSREAPESPSDDPGAAREPPAPVAEGKRHEVLGLLTLALALLSGLALASYDNRGGRDWAGPAGAIVAEALLAVLGSASALVPLSLFVQSVRFFRRTTQPVRPLRVLGTTAIVVTFATGLHLYLGERPALGHLAAGGLVGVTVGESLRALLGTAGAHLVTLTALLIALVIRTRLSVVAFARGAGRAGVKTGHLARDGVVTVARAWQRSREEPAPDAEGSPRRLTPEEKVDRALADVLDTREDSFDEDPEEDDVRDAPAAVGVGALLDRVAHVERTAADRAESALFDEPAMTEPPPPPASEIAPREGSAPAVGGDPSPARRPGRRKAPGALAVPAVASAEIAPPVASEPEPAVVVERAPSSGRADLAAEIASAQRDQADLHDRPPTGAESASRRRPRRSPRPVLVPAQERAVSSPITARDEAPRQPASGDRSARVELQSVPPSAQPPRSSPPPLPSARVERDEPLPAPAPLPIVSHEDEIAAALETPPEPAVQSPRVRVDAPVCYAFPSMALLTPAPREGITVDESALRSAAERLVKTLRDYQIEGEIAEIHPGPVVTTYEFVPTAGTKLARIAARSDDIAMSLAVNKVRIVAPIPGKGRVGFEIPNDSRKTVFFRELVETEAFNKLGGALPVALGKDVVGAPFFSDLAAMPHLIVAGATGQGKSVGLNVMLCSLLYKRAPEDVRMLMIDPKMVELAVYDGIPHMLLPVVTDMKKASLALRWVVDEMERRYSLFAQTGSRNITTYNERVARAINEGVSLKGLAGPVRTKVTGTTTDVSRDPDSAPDAAAAEPVRLPYIVVVVDEFADLMMVAGKEVEAAIARLAQKARAAGIHVILATQRPSVDVITGMIKANFPSRVAFKVSQKVDSRTILDQQGAENLLGRGDMLILPPGSSDLRRVHCAFVSEDEVQAITDHWRNQGTPTYDEDILRPREEDGESAGEEPEIKVPAEKYEKAVALVLSSRRCSVSWIQRQLAIGYNVAARIVERMERDGVVSAPKGPGKDREVLG